VWLNVYRLACQLGGATTDEVIIRNLPLHLADSARTWLEHLPASQIHNWDDLVRTFVGNFHDTYVPPRNSWDLRACTQKPGESLRDIIRRFSKRCTELPSVAQSEIVHAFLEGTTCQDLVRELGRSPPDDSNELFDIATSFSSGEEAVGATSTARRACARTTRPRRVASPRSPSRSISGARRTRSRAAGRAQGRDDDRDKALAVEGCLRPLECGALLLESTLGLFPPQTLALEGGPSLSKGGPLLLKLSVRLSMRIPLPLKLLLRRGERGGLVCKSSP
jgi:hypothetical protein